MTPEQQKLKDIMDNFEAHLNLDVKAFQMIARSAAATAGLTDTVTMADLKEAIAALETVTAKTANAPEAAANRSAALLLNLVSFLCFALNKEFTLDVMVAERPRSNPNMN